MQVTCGTGACRRNGVGCVNGVPQSCTPGMPMPETCNGLDDDCNGSVDDGLGTATCGIGACLRTVNNCSGGTLQQCVPRSPITETCNGLDDNCNGQIDEGLALAAEGVDVRVTVDTIPNDAGGLVWVGDRWAATYWDYGVRTTGADSPASCPSRYRHSARGVG